MPSVHAEQVLAFRLARLGLAAREGRELVEAAACPASAFARDADLLALGARLDSLTREEYDAAVDEGVLVLAHVIRCAIHVLAPDDLAIFGRALVATDDRELEAQIGRPPKWLAANAAITPTEALAEVTAATKEALARGRVLSKDELHEELRGRVRAELLPWCKSCGSHHVAPSLWRYATIEAGARLDSKRRYLLAKPGRTPPAGEALRRFLRFYGPATAGDFAEWAGVTSSHADRIWAGIDGELVETTVGRRRAWLLPDDEPELDSPPQAEGIRLLPPGDPYLAKPNRTLLAPDAELHKRMFRPVASPGAVLRNGRLAGLWRVKTKGKIAEISIGKLGRLARAELEPEAERLARLRGAGEAALVLD
jgi:Winged helix DNA-binding domain